MFSPFSPLLHTGAGADEKVPLWVIFMVLLMMPSSLGPRLLEARNFLRVPQRHHCRAFCTLSHSSYWRVQWAAQQNHWLCGPLECLSSLFLLTSNSSGCQDTCVQIIMAQSGVNWHIFHRSGCVTSLCTQTCCWLSRPLLEIFPTVRCLSFRLKTIPVPWQVHLQRRWGGGSPSSSNVGVSDPLQPSDSQRLSCLRYLL